MNRVSHNCGDRRPAPAGWQQSAGCGAQRSFSLSLSVSRLGETTNVDGLYDAELRTQGRTFDLETVSYHEVTTRDLSAMDMTAIHYAKKTTFPVWMLSVLLCIDFYFIVKKFNLSCQFVIVVFNLESLESLQRLLSVRRLVPSSDAQEIKNEMETHWLKKEY
jgi:hypothetical protein